MPKIQLMQIAQSISNKLDGGLDLIEGKMSPQSYDIIGDIHGHADALRRLLIKMGYVELQGVFQHDSRKVIFVGDFVDRGPQQIEVLRIARKMCEASAAAAVLGNHEFNAIGWATPNSSGGHLRKHSQKKDGQREGPLCILCDPSWSHIEN